MAEQPKLGAEMKDQIAGAVKEKEKIAEGKAEFDKKKPDMILLRISVSLLRVVNMELLIKILRL